MGAGRKTRTFIVNGDSPSLPNPPSSNAHARNLRKNELGAVIFGCKNSTMRECLFKQLFGLPSQHYWYVKNITPGLPLFLFNYSTRKLHGIFEAASPGQLNINPYGWTTDGLERTQYPAQVQIRVQLQCQPLREEQFKLLIKDNYYSHNHFWFELDHDQTSKLITLFRSLPVAPGASVPQGTGEWRSSFRSLPEAETKEETLDVEHLNHLYSNPDSKEVAACLFGGKEEDEGCELLLPFESNSSRKSDSTGAAFSLDEDNQLLDLGLMINEKDDKGLMLMKLNELSLNSERREVTLTDYEEDYAVNNDINFKDRGFLDDRSCLLGNNEGFPSSMSDYQSVIAQVIQEMNELKALERNQSLKMSYLEQKLGEAEKEIQQLKDRCLLLESLSNSSIVHVDETLVESSDGLHLNTSESIFLVGGYDGDTWLSTLDCYFPAQDVIKSFRPMSYPRSYSLVVQLNGEIYVCGGGGGGVDGSDLWYDTVESYNVAEDKWSVCPSLNKENGSLAGAAFNGKIFAIGGGKTNECFSDVEMLDLDLGRWIPTRSMLQKRFALAAVELNGVLYATGGFDGNDYLKSVERLDPREHSWTRIKSMNARRGCHSLVCLNEKLYALGGFDGSVMVSSVEIYDPRLGYWMEGEPMNQARGYSVGAVVKDCIYVIGGVKDNNDLIDTMEKFDGQSWQEVKTRIGKRGFASGIAF